ncbi:GNAT family N-acetyltransferase [Vibrio parahaemolyticus]|uniref:GNAT family N-acetyltransferase n=1 Tax=Vibrio parahaemolyticus TaxID=670 RepID=UPI00193E4DF9|nr:GNAT family N-acetyltransferase [Vibrio parahaemolyticus]EHH1223548.1 GNAT family N-acetyltransferase [Vibrio parahaemolyticus]EIY8174285.1 GNAT family N-acetyltransferase [Vibrio parahaemolyticus]EIY8252219.1 GNAT family N-acetyltransferase [Vibrio parahaemolyticus]ELA8142549.1 GNAT family N-acetyltransferase [Vibrio parahaemolyticus]MBM4896421.1 GNAT family N-acetyltransferase [Vibrio parahaemolyticus]
MEVVEASPDLAPILASYAKECLESGIPKYFGVDQDPEAYLSGLAERSKATSELPNGYLPSTTYYCVSGSKILGAIRIRKGTNANVENVIGHVGYETRPSARGKGVASFLLAWVRDHVVTDSVIVTCSIDNPASQKVIENCGGEYLGNYTSENEGTVRRYRLART